MIVKKIVGSLMQQSVNRAFSGTGDASFRIFFYQVEKEDIQKILNFADFVVPAHLLHLADQS